MSISIVHGSPQTVWMPLTAGVTVYVGSIVCVDSTAPGEGVVVREMADGASNTDNKDVPLGVCVGTNRRTPVFSSTYLAEYITDPGATGIRADTTEYVGVEGEYNKGEEIAMVQVAIITANTVLNAPIRNNAIGTSITELVSSAGNANGLTVTTGACDFTPVDSLSTIYARTGVNAGTYRITDDTSTTVATWDSQTQNTTANTGETYVRAPYRTHGLSYARFGDDTVCSYANASHTPATDYDIIHVLRLNLSDAGNENMDFMFDADTFSTARA